MVALLKDAIHFAVFDSTKSFFHISVDEASKLLTVMLTPVANHTYNVLGMLDSCIQQILKGRNRIINIAYDVLVCGCDYDSFKSNVVDFLD